MPIVLPMPKVRLSAKKFAKDVVVILNININRYVSVKEITYDILSVFYSSSVSILYTSQYVAKIAHFVL